MSKSPAISRLTTGAAEAMGIRPVKTQIAVRLNTVDHVADPLRVRHGAAGMVVGIADSGAPELPHALHVRLDDGDVVVDSRFVEFTDISRVPASHRVHPNATAAWLIVEALREAFSGDYFSRRCTGS